MLACLLACLILPDVNTASLRVALRCIRKCPPLAMGVLLLRSLSPALAIRIFPYFAADVALFGVLNLGIVVVSGICAFESLRRFASLPNFKKRIEGSRAFVMQSLGIC